MAKYGKLLTVVTLSLVLKAVRAEDSGGTNEEVEIDPDGYLLYCPCMGKTGNQADHLLGAMAFAKGLNRTLVIPPWNMYKQTNELIVYQVPFAKHFDPKGIQEYQKAVTMEYFMQRLAKTVWPPDKRFSVCKGKTDPERQIEACKAKDGKPFAPFWDNFNVDFVKSEFYGPHNVSILALTEEEYEPWIKSFPPDKFPVLSFVGAPATFPEREEHRHLQKYIKWNRKTDNEKRKFIHQYLGSGDYISIHLREGPDHMNACSLITKVGIPNLMASPQCLGYNNEHGHLTQEICLPSLDTIVRHVEYTLKDIGGAKYIYMATDNVYRADELQTRLGEAVSVIWRVESDPMMDLAVLGASKHFIGNCVSSFTAFVKRERDANDLPSSFFGIVQKSGHDEL